MYIFLDESGNFKDNKNGYFIVGGFLTGNPDRTAKMLRKWQHKKFPKKIRSKTEVKFSDTGLIVAHKELFDNYWVELYENKKSS